MLRTGARPRRTGGPARRRSSAFSAIPPLRTWMRPQVDRAGLRERASAVALVEARAAAPVGPTSGNLASCDGLAQHAVARGCCAAASSRHRHACSSAASSACLAAELLDMVGQARLAPRPRRRSTPSALGLARARARGARPRSARACASRAAEADSARTASTRALPSTRAVTGDDAGVGGARRRRRGARPPHGRDGDARRPPRARRHGERQRRRERRWHETARMRDAAHGDSEVTRRAPEARLRPRARAARP